MVKMPQRQRHNTGGGAGGAELPLLDPGVIEAHNSVTLSRCCVPLASGCMRGYEPISLDAPTGCVRVVCNNDQCSVGTLMHGECFTAWENHVLAFLRSCGRARSWSEKQRLQNLWTKRGYDLAYRACSCLCGRGHLRKDLDWTPPSEIEEDNKTKKKKRNKQNSKPSLVTIGSGNSSSASTSNNNNSSNNNNNNNSNVNNSSNSSSNNHGQPCQRHRANSISSTGSSPPSDAPSSPHHQGRRKSKWEFFSDRSRHGSGGSGLFARRLDFSSFNALPRSKINSYHIKMEDDGNHGNDDTRCFILSTLAAQRSSRTACALCHQALFVFDRYPLIDGTFFLTPLQHAKSAIPVRVEGRQQYLTAVCMGCLEGWCVTLRCCACHRRWDGSSLILGTMYSFDIFAAMPCCEDRLKCNKCHSFVIPPEQRSAFFSDYSRSVACPGCGSVDHHFVKPLNSFIREERQPW